MISETILKSFRNVQSNTKNFTFFKAPVLKPKNVCFLASSGFRKVRLQAGIVINFVTTVILKRESHEKLQQIRSIKGSTTC